jgi:hypothetical protein
MSDRCKLLGRSQPVPEEEPGRKPSTGWLLFWHLVPFFKTTKEIAELTVS